MRYLFTFIVLACSALASLALDQDISKLPNGIEAPATGVALIADFEHPLAGKIPVYLVNRSGTDIVLQAQDGEVYLLLEYRDTDGQWRRAQRCFFSWCGNSYDDKPTVQNDHFVALSGFQPARGDKVDVRFRLHQQRFDCASNVGQGHVEPDDVQAARRDDLALHEGDFDFVASVALGKWKMSDTSKPPRMTAIYMLGTGRKFERSQSEKVLREIVAARDDPFSKLAQRELDRFSESDKAMGRPK